MPRRRSGRGEMIVLSPAIETLVIRYLCDRSLTLAEICRRLSKDHGVDVNLKTLEGYKDRIFDNLSEADRRMYEELKHALEEKRRIIVGSYVQGGASMVELLRALLEKLNAELARLSTTTVSQLDPIRANAIANMVRTMSILVKSIAEVEATKLKGISSNNELFSKLGEATIQVLRKRVPKDDLAIAIEELKNEWKVIELVEARR